MRPLTVDDLLSLQEYSSRRRELHEAYLRYLDRYRRVRLGPHLTLIFENRQTLWYRIHEVLRIARLAEPGLVQRELNLFNQLLPGRHQLQASLLLSDESALEESAWWHGLNGQDVRLRVGVDQHSASLITCRPEDRAIGTAHWVCFTVDAASRRGLSERKRPLYFDVVHPDYRYSSAALSDDLRRSLLEDLELSDRDREVG
jgi:hypothetical protein